MLSFLIVAVTEIMSLLSQFSECHVKASKDTSSVLSGANMQTYSRAPDAVSGSQ